MRYDPDPDRIRFLCLRFSNFRRFVTNFRCAESEVPLGGKYFGLFTFTSDAICVRAVITSYVRCHVCFSFEIHMYVFIRLTGVSGVISDRSFMTTCRKVIRTMSCCCDMNNHEYDHSFV